MVEKNCSRCQQNKRIDQFSLSRRQRDGRSVWCKACQAEYHAVWRVKNAASDKARQKSWRKKNREHYLANLAVYREQNRGRLVDAETGRRCGLTRATVETLRSRHNGRCDICDTDNPGTGRVKMSLDHCHRTGGFRGFLCNLCNRAIGMLGDDPGRLRSAAAYLERARHAADDRPADDHHHAERAESDPHPEAA